MDTPPPQDATHRATDDRQPTLSSAQLPDVEALDLPRPDMVTAVIRQQVRPDHWQAYEDWLHRIIPIAARFPGHRGAQVIKPPAGSFLYTVTLHFDTIAHADDWFRSEARQALLREVAPLLASPEEVKTVTGLEFWFEPPAAHPAPRRFKQALATWSVIFPLTSLLGMTLGPWLHAWLGGWGRLAANLAVSGITVVLMTYVIMPRYTRWLARWLSR
ncbi:antibiotic biosynthesis monooxygenase [Roseateles amylovorans]|uniref:Antibiotic biosynthesis monooxygenase n=1 Tax=Roseateles amylovorans TaxID=2978473 RepID=A0ABY6AXX7_9BURK|nr:antibiotic biosynthesis monooxygenase [Roseateles amylovorans]UXH77752.1 antibiotic biosynthesis monooxygenase [Roseateles amylovorans]